MEALIPVIGYVATILIGLCIILPYWAWRDRLKKYRDNGYRDAESHTTVCGIEATKNAAKTLGDTAYAEGYRLYIQHYEG